MLKEGMKIEARHVRRKQLAQYIDVNYVKRERKVSESLNNSASMTQLAKKRLSVEMGQLNHSASRRSKLQESVSWSISRKFLKRSSLSYLSSSNSISEAIISFWLFLVRRTCEFSKDFSYFFPSTFFMNKYFSIRPSKVRQHHKRLNERNNSGRSNAGRLIAATTVHVTIWWRFRVSRERLGMDRIF